MQRNVRLAGMVSGLEMILNLGRTMCKRNDKGALAVLALPGFAGKVCGSVGWLSSHPPLAERIARIYGRSMPAMATGDVPQRRDAIF